MTWTDSHKEQTCSGSSTVTRNSNPSRCNQNTLTQPSQAASESILYSVFHREQQDRVSASKQRFQISETQACSEKKTEAHIVEVLAGQAVHQRVLHLAQVLDRQAAGRRLAPKGVLGTFCHPCRQAVLVLGSVWRGEKEKLREIQGSSMSQPSCLCL